MEDFQNRTIRRREYEVVEVNGDGLCLYRCMIRFLVDYQKELNKNQLFYKIFNDEKIKEGEASIHLQMVLKDWILEHKDEKLDSSLPIEGTISDLVMIDHGDYIDSIETYGDLYSIPANEESSFMDEMMGERIFIPMRWGGMTEIYAFSKIFGIEVNQWKSRRWNVIKMEIEDCEKNERGSRLELIQKIGEGEFSLDVLYEDYGFQARHYTYLRNTKQMKQMKQKLKGLKKEERREKSEIKNGRREEEEGKEEDSES